LSLVEITLPLRLSVTNLINQLHSGHSGLCTWLAYRPKSKHGDKWQYSRWPTNPIRRYA